MTPPGPTTTQPTSAAPATAARFCPACGYDLRGITTTCPECGHAADDATLQRATIPWQRRDELGRWRAYWQTTALALRRQRRFAAALALPVDENASRRFGAGIIAISTLLLAPAIALATLFVLHALTADGLNWANLTPHWPAYVGGALVGLVLSLVVFGEGSVWLIGKLGTEPVRAGRAAALSRYTWAPVPPTIVCTLGSWALSAAVMATGGQVLLGHLPQVLGFILWLAGFVFVLTGLGPTAWTLDRLLRAAGFSAGRSLLVNLGVGLMGLGTLPLFFVALPWSVGFAWQMLTTLR